MIFRPERLLHILEPRADLLPHTGSTFHNMLEATVSNGLCKMIICLGSTPFSFRNRT
jgi:hypothetical protein